MNDSDTRDTAVVEARAVPPDMRDAAVVEARADAPDAHAAAHGDARSHDETLRFDDAYWDDAFCAWWDPALRTCCG